MQHGCEDFNTAMHKKPYRKNMMIKLIKYISCLFHSPHLCCLFFFFLPHQPSCHGNIAHGCHGEMLLICLFNQVANMASWKVKKKTEMKTFYLVVLAVEDRAWKVTALQKPRTLCFRPCWSVELLGNFYLLFRRGFFFLWLKIAQDVPRFIF